MAKRKFTAEEKFKILEEARQPGASVAEVCWRHRWLFAVPCSLGAVNINEGCRRLV